MKTILTTAMLIASLSITGHGQTTAPASSARSSQGQPFWRGKVMENEPVLFIRNEGKPAAPAADPLDSYNVVWDSPSENAQGSMPLGNGDVGINAWVESNGDLVFYIGKTDAWNESATLCKIGRIRVKFDPPLAPKDGFRQELKLRVTAVLIV